MGTILCLRFAGHIPTRGLRTLPLEYIFFADVHGPAEQNGAKERRFADDLSCSKEFAGTVANEDVLTDMRRSQADIHAWGRRNQVAFDPLKEEFAILAASGGNENLFGDWALSWTKSF